MSSAITVYAESTPNPASMKFVLNKFLLQEGSVDFTDKESAVNSPLATELFKFTGVIGVFIASNFVTVTKAANVEWFDIMPILREFIKGYVASNNPIIYELPKKVETISLPASESGIIEEKIKQLLDEYVRPAVEQDGGAITLKSYNKGVVTVLLKGACSGCPSSTITLKAGIENILKRMIPEVTEVVSEAM